MNRRTPGLLLFLCAAGLALAQDPQATPTPTPGNAADAPLALDAIARMDMRTLTMQEFAAANPHNGFHWLSSAHDSAENTRNGLTLFQIPVYQVVVRSPQGKVKEIVISFYNRGDGGELPKDKFESLVQACTQALSSFTKLNPVERGKDPTNAVKAQGLIWQTDKSQFLLEYSFSKTPEEGYRAEFVRLSIIPPAEKPKSLLEESIASSLPAARFSGPDHVKRLPNGDVLIQGIPMVDQGEKGYCVVASAERVLRYYGKKVDENELAEIANTSAEKGTSPAAMIDSLKKLTSRLHIKTRALEEFNEDRFNAMFEEYNRFAKHAQGAKELDLNVNSYSEIFQQMNPDILVEARTKNPSEMNRFFRTVQAHIDQGVPPLWSVMIGLIPHGSKPADYGGHMRLIIGYNLKTNEILYSDSWGYGHELKRMPLVDAWTMTTGLSSIEPLD